MAEAIATWRLLHVLGAVLMLGNVLVTGAWAAILWRLEGPRNAAAISRGILWTDLIFTAGGGALLTIAGIQLVRLEGLPWRELPWLRHGIALLAAATLTWLVILLPDQFRMDRCRATDPTRFARLFRRWMVIGWLDTVLLLAGFSLMMLKPGA